MSGQCTYTMSFRACALSALAAFTRAPKPETRAPASLYTSPVREFPKIRKTVKWGGLAVAVVMLVLWAGARWRVFGYYETKWAIGVWGQGVWCQRWHYVYDGLDRGWWTSPALGWDVSQLRPRSTFEAPYTEVYIPFWMLALGALLIAAGAWRLDVLAARRRRTGMCPKCQYDRAGLSAMSPCPECGAVPVVAKAEPTTEKPTSSTS